MSNLYTDNEASNNNASRLESNSSFIQHLANPNRSSPARKNLFTTDQEIFVDTYSPLILLNDTNSQPPLPSFYGGSKKENKDKDKDKDETVQGSINEFDSPRKGHRKSTSPKRDSTSPKKRRQTRIQIEGLERKPSMAISNAASDVISVSKEGKEAKDVGSESASIMKAGVPADGEVDIFDHKEEPKKDLLVKENKATKFFRAIIDSGPFTTITMLLTFFSLFSQDLSSLALPRGADWTFDIITMVVLGWFSVEILTAMFVRPGYAGTFFFYLDIVSTVSLLFDIDPFMDFMFSPGSVFQKVSKFFSIGIRAARVVRIVRLGALGKIYFKIMAHIRAKTKFLFNIVEQSGLAVLDLGLAATNKVAQVGLAAVDMGLAAGNKVKQAGLAAVDVGLAATNKVKDLGVAAGNKVKQAGLAAVDLGKDVATIGRKKRRGKKAQEDDSAVIDLNANQSFSPGLVTGNNLDSSMIAPKPLDQEGEIEEKKEEEKEDENKKGKGKKKDKERGKVRGSIEFLKKLRRKDALSFRFDMPEIPEPPEELKESRVAKKLSERTTKKVVLMILATLFVSPFFEADFFYDVKSSQEFQMQWIAEMIDDPLVSDATETFMINSFIDSHKHTSPKLVILKLGDDILFDSPTLNTDKIRDSELFESFVMTKTKGKLFSIVTSKSTAELDSIFGLARTFFTCILIMFGAIMVTKDARDLCLQPLERIIVKVNMIAKNPLWAKEQAIINDKTAGLGNETVFVENAVIKIGGLLALGFGDAGSAIIAQNVAKSGDLNPMLPGKKKAAVYGFCDIRQFTDTTEILQEDVMVFVNSIADVVHSLVDKFAGAANKNIGDAFLLVWKFPESSAIELPDGQFEIMPTKITKNIADCAVISFIKLYARINRDPTMLAYRTNPKLNVRMPNYKVKMGLGMHVGWAIEGAIGSEFKIDTSFLSSDVNMSSKLEAATKAYGVPLLISGDLYDMLSDDLQDKARLIDMVKEEGAPKPMELYTVDMDAEDIKLGKDKSKVPKEERRKRQAAKKDRISELVISGDVFKTVFETDKELKHLFRNNDEEFNNEFAAGFDAYVEGDWATAKKKFDICLAKRPEDAPTKTLMKFLEDYDHIAPEDWEGYRPFPDH